MSDMIKNLQGISHEVGIDVAGQLGERMAVDDMNDRIRRGVRKRRTIQAGVTFVTVLAGGVAAVVLPTLAPDKEPEGLFPAAATIVHTDGTLTTYSDGMLSVLLNNAEIVNLKPSEADLGGIQSSASGRALCGEGYAAFDGGGWSYASAETRRLLGFGYPQAHNADDTRTFLTDSSSLTMTRGHKWSVPAFAFDVDKNVAPHIVTEMSAVVLDLDGVPLWSTTKLEASPDYTVTGGGDGGKPSARIETGPINFGLTPWCDGTLHYGDHLDVGAYDLLVLTDIWLSDRQGNVVLLGSYHYSIFVEVTE